MPKSEVKKSKLFRESSKLADKYVKHNYLKNIRHVKTEFILKNKIPGNWLDFMLWTYDLEFFTIWYAADEYGMYQDNLEDRLIYPTLNEGYLYKNLDTLTPSQTREDHLFRDETKYNYRVRYALSQKGRMAVQRFYNSL